MLLLWHICEQIAVLSNLFNIQN